jgi:hypothetical protein
MKSGLMALDTREGATGSFPKERQPDEITQLFFD